MSRRRDAGETGAALAFVVLLMLALLVVAHGSLVASLAELAASRAAGRHLRARGAAERALGVVLSRAPEPWMDSLAVWDVRTLRLGPVGGMQAEARVRRLGDESWLVEGSASSAGGGGARSARLAWALDPLARVTALTGAATVAGGAPVVLAGVVDAAAPAAVRSPMQPGDCDPWWPDLVTRYAAAPLATLATLPDSTAAPALGLVDLEQLLAAAPVTISGAGTPRPVESLGACLVDEPWAWGDPDRPWRPCGPHLPMRASTGDLAVSGGVGQGLLVVDGDLTLEAGARFFGMALTRGAVRLEGGSTLEGLVLAGGGLAVGSGSTLRASACWAVRALAAQREVLGGFSLVSGAHIGPM